MGASTVGTTCPSNDRLNQRVGTEAADTMTKPLYICSDLGLFMSTLWHHTVILTHCSYMLPYVTITFSHTNSYLNLSNPSRGCLLNKYGQVLSIS